MEAVEAIEAARPKAAAMECASGTGRTGAAVERALELLLLPLMRVLANEARQREPRRREEAARREVTSEAREVRGARWYR